MEKQRQNILIPHSNGNKYKEIPREQHAINARKHEEQI